MCYVFESLSPIDSIHQKQNVWKLTFKRVTNVDIRPYADRISEPCRITFSKTDMEVVRSSFSQRF